MKTINDNQLSISPVKNYEPPKLPTLNETRQNPTILKNLPSRWQRNTAVLSCLGIAGMLTLSGCYFLDDITGTHHGGTAAFPIYVNRPTEQDASGAVHQMNPISTSYNPTTQDTEDYVDYTGNADYAYTQMEPQELNLRLHTGGSGSGPFYVVHLTEQEAQSIIRAQLESAGLRFNDTPPSLTPSPDPVHPYDRFGIDAEQLGLNLFDEERGVAVAHISWDNNNIQFFSHGGSHTAELIAEEFAQLIDDISVGVFFNPGLHLGESREWLERNLYWALHGAENSRYAAERERQQELAEQLQQQLDEHESPTPEQKAEAREVLIEQLTAQVQEFLDLLRSQGIV